MQAELAFKLSSIAFAFIWSCRVSQHTGKQEKEQYMFKIMKVFNFMQVLSTF